VDNVVGLDVSKYAVRAASVEVQGSQLNLLAVKENILGDHPENYTAVQSIFSDKQFPKSQVWAGIPINDCVLRNMTVPFTNDDQIKQTIKFSCEEVISDDINNYLLDYKIVEKSEHDSALIIIAGRREAIADTLEMYHHSHVDLDGLTCSKLALYNLAARIHSSETTVPPTEKGNSSQKKTTETDSDQNDLDEDYVVVDDTPLNKENNFLVLDIGVSTADVIVGNADKLMFYRGISTAYDTETDEVFDSKKIARLFKEIKRTLWSGQLDDSFSVIYLCGGISGVPNIVQSIQQTFNCPTQIMPVEKAFDTCVDDKNLALYAQAVGLAIMSSKKAMLSINFRREEFLKTPILLQVKIPLILTLIIVLSWLSWEGYRNNLTKQHLERQNNKQEIWQIEQAISLLATDDIKNQIAEKSTQEIITILVNEGILPDDSMRTDNPEWLEDILYSKVTSVGTIKEKPYVLETFKAFLVHMKGFPDFRLKTLSINHNNINLKGSFSDEQNMDKFEFEFKQRLKKSELFKLHKIPTPKKEPDNRIYFNLTIGYKKANA